MRFRFSRRRVRLFGGALGVVLGAGLLLPATASADPYMHHAWDRDGSWQEGDKRGLKVIPGQSPPSSDGPRRRFILEIDRKLGRDGENFAEEVVKILYDYRSWGGRGRLGMRRVDSGKAAFRVTLAKPSTTDELCAPLATNGIYSCWNGYRAVINSMRWMRGAEPYKWDKFLIKYRRYLINHEVGHALGHGHRYCPARGAEAPVMMQQTKGVRPCSRNWWPLYNERGPAPT